jgi:probable HAF family extracellular repeat protein
MLSHRNGRFIIAAATVLLFVPGSSSAAAGSGDGRRPPAGVTTIPLDTSCGLIGTTMMTGRGDVIGQCEDSLGGRPAILWRWGDPPVELGIEGRVWITGVNDLGHVVGESEVAGGSGFLWAGGRVTYLTYDGDLVRPAGVNRHDQVVGTVSAYDTLNERAFVWRRGVFSLLPTPAGWRSYGHMINDRGQVLGELVSRDDLYRSRTVVWDRGRMIDLGSLAGGNTVARMINARGEVIGVSEARPDEYHPFRWAHGRMVDLLAGTGAGTGFATDINSSGTVVGLADSRPVEWRAGAMRYLTPPGYFGHARFVNDHGDIAGVICPVLGEPCEPGNQIFLRRDGTTSRIDTPAGYGGVTLNGMDDRGRLLGRYLIADFSAQGPLVVWSVR